MAQYSDSIGKVVDYIRVLAKESFIYKGKLYRPPKKLIVSRLFFRDFTCPVNCGACCFRFTLDYLAITERAKERMKRFPNHLKERWVEVNGRKVKVISDLQDDHNDKYCRHLNKKTGRCNIHGVQAFPCDFEPRRLMYISTRNEGILIKKKAGRGWSMTRVTGIKGILCELIRGSKESIDKDIELLKELSVIANAFCIKTWIPEILSVINFNKDKLNKGLLPKRNIVIH